MSWNWLGWLLWIAAIAFLVYVIHYIRVKQLMLIAKTHQHFEKGLFFRYVVLLVVAIAWFGLMGYATWFRPVSYADSSAVTTKTTYTALQLSSSGNDYYYVRVNHSNAGNHGVVSYTYQTQDGNYTTSAYFSSLVDGNNVLPATAMDLPWNKKKLNQTDTQTGHDFVAAMTVRYKNTLMNGIGIRANHIAIQYNLIRIPSDDMEIQK